MAKKNKRRSFPPVEETKKEVRKSAPLTSPRTRWELVVLFFVIAVGGTYLAVWMKPGNAIPEYGFKVINKYKHDGDAFTQGLLFHDGFLYESTGLEKQSSLRKVEPETGMVLKQLDLDDKLFGEGLTRK